MADAVPAQQNGAPAAAAQGEKEKYIQQTPVWVVVVRSLQIFFSFVILGMAGYLIHKHAMDANAFAVVCSVFTWIVTAYVLTSEKVESARKAYNIWAVLALDFLMVVFWLASLGANAALRASFKHDVNIAGCYDNGNLISSSTCYVYKRSGLAKRAAVAGDVGLALMSAVAGVSALEWLLFLATLIFHGHTFRLWHQEHKTPPADNATAELKAEPTPPLNTQTTTTPAPQQQYPPQVYPQQQQQAPAMYPQAYPNPAVHAPAQGYAAFPDPAQYQPPYSPQGTPAPEQQQQAAAYGQHGMPAVAGHHHPYSPQGTPAPEQQQQAAAYRAHEMPAGAGHQAYSPHGTPAPGQGQGGYYPPQYPGQ